MLEQGKISLRQIKVLALFLYLGSTILIIPSPLAAVAKQDGWISAMLGAAAGLLLIWLYAVLGKHYPSLSLAEYSELALGKWAGKLVGLLYFSFFLLLTAMVLRNIGDFITTIMMPETPIQAIHIIIMGCAVVAVRLGLEVIGRASEMFLPGVIVLILILLVFITPQVKLDWIKPVMESGMLPVLRGSFTVIGIPYLEFVVFLMLIPYVNKQSKAGKALMTGAIIGGIIFILIVVLSLLVLGWDFTARHTFPTYTMAKKIRIGEFLQRIEVFMGVTWILTMFFKLAVVFYAAALGLAQTLRLSDYRPVVLPLGMFCVILAMAVYPDIVYFRTFIDEVWTAYAMTFGLLLPLLLLAATRLRGKGKGAGKQRNSS